MEPPQNYAAIISAIDLDAIYHEVTKKSRLDAPEELNYAATIHSTFVRYVERIPTIKDLVKRLHDDIAFKLNCGFLVSDDVPSEASYSRLATKEEKLKLEPKKRGRKSKEEREQWLKEQAEKEANLSLYEKRIKAQLDVSLDELRAETRNEM